MNKHERRIAEQTLAMPDAMVGVMGGPSKAEARLMLEGEPPRSDPIKAPWVVAVAAVLAACPSRSYTRWRGVVGGMVLAETPGDALVFIEAARGLVYELTPEPELTKALEAAREACVAVAGEGALEAARLAQFGALKTPPVPVLAWRVTEEGTHEAWAGIHTVRIPPATIATCEGQTVDDVRLIGETELRKTLELQLKNARLALTEFDARTAEYWVARGDS